MVTSANKPPLDLRDVLLILGPGYDEMVVGYYDVTNECWRERSTDGMQDGAKVYETKDCYVAGWMEKPDMELWKDQLIGEYEWEREHYDSDKM